jgi:hypothetical protein
MLRQLAVMVPRLAVTTRPGSWRHGGAQLLLAEAFITAAASQSRCQQARMLRMRRRPGLALTEILDGSAPLTSSVRCAPQEPFNLLAAMALWAGLRIDPRRAARRGPGCCRPP